MSTVKTNNVQIGQSVTATNNATWYQPATPDGTVRLGVGNAGATTADILIANSSGNLGLGVTPSAWSGYGAVIQLQNNGAIVNNATNDVHVTNNCYYNAGWKYTVTNPATRFEQFNGGHYWFTAPSGTAGNAISFTQAMTLDASGNLLVGTTSSSGSTANSAKLVAGQMKTAAGAVNSSSTATTMFSLSTVGVYYVSAMWGASNASAFDAFAVILYDGSSARIALSSNGSQILISLSGTNVQLTNNYNTAQVNWSYMVQSLT